MSDSQSTGDLAANPSQDDRMSALFAQLILQQSNMALMLLGKVAHPQSGQIARDLEAAQMFIDQLEMLEAKTRGNLNKDESSILKSTLMSLRLAFVEAAEEPEQKSEPKPQTPPPGNTPAPDATAGTPPPASDEEHRKKFTKKY